MNPKTEHVLWPGQAGPIEVSIDKPSIECIGLAVLAHPHPLFGGTKDNKVVQTMARALLGLGYLTVRFNFRGVGQSAGEHDNGIAEQQDMIYLMQKAQTLLPQSLANHPVTLGGFSFGAFVASHVAEHLKALGTPVGKLLLVGSAASRFTMAKVPSNSLIIHGEIDDTVPLQSVLDWAATCECPVMVIPKVEHFFHGRLPQLKDLIMRHYPA